MSRAAGLLWLVPLAAFAVEAVAGTGGYDVPARALGATLVLAGTAAATALLLGVPVGLVLADGRRAWPSALSLFPLLCPPILMASAWFGLGLPLPGPAGCGARASSSGPGRAETILRSR